MIKAMLKLQKKLNDNTNGTQWLIDGLTKDGNEINWCRCMRFELCEAIDQSILWKHWKDTKHNKQYSILDLSNLKMELVDTGHFLNSEIIRRNLNSDIIHQSIDEGKFNYIEKGKPLVIAIEDLIKSIYKYEEEDETSQLLTINYKFWEIVFSVMTLEEFFQIYLGKNCLNQFRQDNGYKDGTYIKLWGDNQIEDNVFLDTYFKERKDNNIPTFDELYSYLQNTYKTLNSKKIKNH